MMDDAWNELSFDFEPAVQAALPASGVGNTRDRFRTQVCGTVVQLVVYDLYTETKTQSRDH